MNSVFRLKRVPAAVLYLVGVIACVSAGMSAPLLCIGLGSIVGWYTARRELLRAKGIVRVLRRVARVAVVTSLWTLLVMSVIWGTQTWVPSGFQASLARAGLPAMQVGARGVSGLWLALIVVGTPALQLMSTVLASHLTILACLGAYETAARRRKVSELTAYRLRVGAGRSAA